MSMFWVAGVRDSLVAERRLHDDTPAIRKMLGVPAAYDAGVEQ